MHAKSIPVATRIATLKNIFNKFGIQVYPNSELDLLLTAEFGRGKRSAMTNVLNEMVDDPEAEVLARCIGAALQEQTDNPEIVAIGSVLHKHIPNIIHVINFNQRINLRVKYLDCILNHFQNKLESTQDSKLANMIKGAREQLRSTLELQSISHIAAEVGAIFKISDLERGAKIFHGFVPLLVSLDQPQISLEQKASYCLQALEVLSIELRDSKIMTASLVLNRVVWLASINLSAVPDQAKIDQALQDLGVSLGNMSLHKLRQKAKQLGLSDQDIVQIIYHNYSAAKLDKKDQELLSATKENKQYAASCSLISQLGHDIDCQELSNIGTAGLCLVSLRQSYYEIKTGNLNAANCSESLGLILSNAGILCKSKTLTNLGTGILDGLKAYSAIMAIPGGQAVAVPLAVCAVLTKLILRKKARKASPAPVIDQTCMQHLLGSIIRLQQDMRQQFAHIYKKIEQNHMQLLQVLDQGFAQLESSVNYNQAVTAWSIHELNMQVINLHYSISKEFSNLYFEYIREPLEELEFYDRYQQHDLEKLKQIKHKLSMWLLLKAKHPKVNGRDLIDYQATDFEIDNQILKIISKIQDTSAITGLINRYINQEFAQQLPEDLPHMPTWLRAAEAYVHLLNEQDEIIIDELQELNILDDLIQHASMLQNFVRQLAHNNQLWSCLTSALDLQLAAANCSLENVLVVHPIAQPELQNMHVTAATAAPANQQLELFDNISLDLSQYWTAYFLPSLPVEIFQAQAYGLGTLNVQYAIDPAVNLFANARMPCSTQLFPTEARYVLFRINVKFNLKSNQQIVLLQTGWFAYDLANGYNRLTEYYQLKFKYGLRHSRYWWISLDGRRNLVAGHPESDTNKLIDYSRLATVYNRWWQSALPVNDPLVTARLRSNQPFCASFGSMLDQGQCVKIEQQNIDLLKLQLQVEIQQHEFNDRIRLVGALQQAMGLEQALIKIDCYTAIINALRQVINLPSQHNSISNRFHELMRDMLATQKPQRDYLHQLQNLIIAPTQNFDATVYPQGLFFQSVQASEAGLKLLQSAIRLKM